MMSSATRHSYTGPSKKNDAPAKRRSRPPKHMRARSGQNDSANTADDVDGLDLPGQHRDAQSRLNELKEVP
jgi:hypothetical protein